MSHRFGATVIRNVVLIDDDPAVLESLGAVFSSAGYDVESFGSAAAFLTALPGLAPSCIISDLRMPDMDGLALLKLTSEMGLPSPVIIISGHAGVVDAVAAMRAGAVDVLIKPFPPRRLVALVKACLETLPTDDGLPEGDNDATA